MTNLKDGGSIKDRFLLYLDILKVLINKKIKFSRTKSLPILSHALYCKPNHFRDFCDKMIKIFLDISDEWRTKISPNTISVRKKGGRATASKYRRYYFQSVVSRYFSL